MTEQQVTLNLGRAALTTREVDVSTYRQRQKEKQEFKSRTAVVGLVYVVGVIAVAYLLSILVISQVDLYDLLGLDRTEIPVINLPGRDIPQWVLQLVLVVLIFFFIQPLVYIAVALFGGGKKEEQQEKSFQNPWER